MMKGTTSRRMKVIGVVSTIFLILPAVAFAGQRFDDVDDDNIFAADIGWLADAEVTRGCDPPANTDFCPDDNVTRQQMAAFLHRLADNRVVDAGTVEGFSAADLMGSAGPAGPAGADGAQGPAGADGVDGVDGAQGPAGADGVDGVQGPAGADGVDGVDGVDGAQGPHGPQGEQGPAGPALVPTITTLFETFAFPAGGPFDRHDFAVACPQDTQVLVGGFDMSDAGTVLASAPSGNGWLVSATRAPNAKDPTVTVWAVCAEF